MNRCPTCGHPFAHAAAERRARQRVQLASARQLAVMAAVYVILGAVLTLMVEVFVRAWSR